MLNNDTRNFKRGSTRKMDPKIIATILILIITGMWGMFSPSDVIMKIAMLAIDGIAVFCFLSDYKKVNSAFKKPLLFFLICLAINIAGVYIFRNQSIVSSLRGIDMLNFLSIFSLFIFHRLKLSEYEARQILKLLMWMFIGCYLLQWMIFPHQLFYVGGDGAYESYAASGHIRFRLQAQGIAFLAVFYSIYKAVNEQRLSNYLLMALSLIVVIMFEFRSQLLLLPFIIILQLFFYGKLKLRRHKVLWMCAALLVVGFVLMQTDIVGGKIASMLNRSVTQNFNNEDYIRYRTFEYFTRSVPHNMYERIFGTGLEGLDGQYTNYMLGVKRSGYIWADWGLIGLTWILGIPGVLCLIWYSIKAYMVSRRFYDIFYIGVWFLFLILAGTFNREFFRFGIFGIQALALYILDIRMLKVKYKFMLNENRHLNFSSRT